MRTPSWDRFGLELVVSATIISPKLKTELNMIGTYSPAETQLKSSYIIALKIAHMPPSRKWLVDVHSADWPLRDVADDVLALVDIPARPSRVRHLELILQMAWFQVVIEIDGFTCA